MGCAIKLQLSVFSFPDATSGSSPTAYDVKIYDTNSDLLYENDVSAASEPSGVWDGLALSYSLAATLNHNANGEIIGVNGSYAGPLNILQNFWESVLSNPLDSSTVEVQ
jgi:hypothetical protein